MHKESTSIASLHDDHVGNAEQATNEDQQPQNELVWQLENSFCGYQDVSNISGATIPTPIHLTPLEQTFPLQTHDQLPASATGPRESVGAISSDVGCT